MNDLRRILVVFGTRPEAIKMAPIILNLRERVRLGAQVDFRICVTAQHREMLDQVLRLFEINPDFDLEVMRAEQDLTDITSRVLEGMRQVFRKYHPDLVLVHGDTTTTFASALAAFYEHIPVGHVEAGLRTGDIFSPWPEEMNRRIVADIAKVHFAPTEGNRQNLRREGVADSRIHVTGNTVIDALKFVVKRINDDVELRYQLDGRFSYLDRSRRLILVTGHRRENLGERFEKMCLALKRIGDRNDVEIIYPVHLNPNVREPVNRVLAKSKSIHLIEPLDYLPFVYLIKRAYLVLTDSGGLQEEAPSLGKPVLVMRDTTERPEAVAEGTAKLVGTDEETILSEVSDLLDRPDLYHLMTMAQNPYGDGNAAERIVNLCIHIASTASEAATIPHGNLHNARGN